MTKTTEAETADTTDQDVPRDLELQVVDTIRQIALRDEAVDILASKFSPDDGVSRGNVNLAISMFFALIESLTEDVGLAAACFLVHTNLSGLEAVLGFQPLDHGMERV